MCATCALTGDPQYHIDGTLLNRDLVPIFQGTSEQITDQIMKYPLLAHAVWVAGEGEPISIDEWTKWMDQLEET